MPSRPESARGRRPGQARQRARRARWRHEWREAKGFRFYRLDGDRIVHVLSWHQVLDYYHCPESLHKVAKAPYGHTLQAPEWVEATLPRLYMGQVGTVRGGLRRMQPTAEEALKAIDNCWVYLNDHRGRTDYDKFRRGGYPLGSGGVESSNTFICHVRLKRSGAWWYEESSTQMLALRCAKDDGTFDQVFTLYQHQKADS